MTGSGRQACVCVCVCCMCFLLLGKTSQTWCSRDNVASSTMKQALQGHFRPSISDVDVSDVCVISD